MLEILEPLEVGAGDTAAVGQEVRRANDASLQQDLLRSERGRPIGTLENGFALEFWCIHFVNGFLDGARN